MSSINVNRLSREDIGTLVGDEALGRLVRKTRGGDAGSKGVKYEHLFAAYRAACLLGPLLTDGDDPLLEWQSDGFLDDFVERVDSKGSFRAYQLKNAQQVSWVAGATTLEQECQWQYAVSHREGYTDINLRVVCSEADVADRLARSVPASVASYAGAEWFPWGPTLLPLLSSHAWIMDQFGQLSKHELPSAIQAHDVAAVMLGAWSVLGSRVTVSQLISQARNMSPTLLRSLRSDEEAEAQLLPEFRAIADSWHGFTYRIIRSFLSWSAFGGSTSGVLPMDCFDSKFVVWQQRIVERRPTTFEDVEEVF